MKKGRFYENSIFISLVLVFVSVILTFFLTELTKSSLNRNIKIIIISNFVVLFLIIMLVSFLYLLIKKFLSEKTRAPKNLTNRIDFFNCYFNLISNSKQNIHFSGGGVSPIDPESTDIFNRFIAVIKKALEKGRKIYRYQIFNNASLKWLEELAKIKKQYKEQISIYDFPYEGLTQTDFGTIDDQDTIISFTARRNPNQKEGSIQATSFGIWIKDENISKEVKRFLREHTYNVTKHLLSEEEINSKIIKISNARNEKITAYVEKNKSISIEDAPFIALTLDIPDVDFVREMLKECLSNN